jgi:hypothetical protein
MAIRLIGSTVCDGGKAVSYSCNKISSGLPVRATDELW